MGVLLPDEEPEHRLHAHGPETLSDAELVAVVTGYSIERAREMVRDGLHVFAATDWRVRRRAHITPRIAARIEAGLEIGRRLSSHDASEERQDADAGVLGRQLMARYRDDLQEHFGLFCLDSRDRIVVQREVFKGTLHSACVSTREVMQLALDARAAGIIVYHNHPSGEPTPSYEDQTFTRNLLKATDLMDLDLTDHLVIGRTRFVSMRQRGDIAGGLRRAR
jgi:DNA repair protein RadC